MTWAVFDGEGALQEGEQCVQVVTPQGTAEGTVELVEPLAELYKYSTALRSMTGGRATHRREFSHYEPMPHDQMQKVIAQAELDEEEED